MGRPGYIFLVMEERGQRHDLPVAVFTDRRDLLTWLERQRSRAVAARDAALAVPPGGQFDDIPPYATLMVWQLRDRLAPGELLPLGRRYEPKLLGSPNKVLGEAEPELPALKSAHSCRLCGFWLEGAWNRSTSEVERAKLQREMDRGRCDTCPQPKRVS